MVRAINGGPFDVLVCNFANCDRVGHTVVMDEAIQSVKVISRPLQQEINTLKYMQGQMLAAAGHGAIELMADEPGGQPHALHIADLAPLIYIGGMLGVVLNEEGSLPNSTPAALDILGTKQPVGMTFPLVTVVKC